MKVNHSKNRRRKNYYIDAKRKAGDIFLGIFGSWLLAIILIFLGSQLNISGVYGFIVFLLFILIEIIGMIIFRLINRKYISLGILISLLIPIVFFLLFFVTIIIISS